MNEKAHPPSNNTLDGCYRNQRIALLTQHGKESVIAPALEGPLGCRVQRVKGFDTDLLGTFTRDITRAGTQLEAARKKARIGMELAGLPVGIASEGAFGPDPLTGTLPWNVEILVWIDDWLGIEIVATSSGKTNFSHRQVETLAEAVDFARSIGFPEHRLVVRPSDENYPRFRKGLADWNRLQDAVTWALALAPNRRAFVETDMRAFANPTRMENIRLAAEDLVRRLTSFCPTCGAPGFVPAEQVPGLPCEDCGALTREAKADIYRCVRCAHQQVVERDGGFASARSCVFCNP